ncbi:MAG: class I SAM-dependent methyltransferase [Gammaproteobacteria bacterium]|nr:class I SAM-dependent methyltransferase [Gammaproteobacteria bacterium]
MDGNKGSWLLSKRRFLKRGAVGFREFLLKYTRFLGLKIADILVTLGYTIKTSHVFNNVDLKTCKRRSQYYDEVAKEFSLDTEKVSYLEFGVYKGDSLRYWLTRNTNSESRFHGFDTFTGLPEDWGHIPKGHFSTEGRLPTINDERCHFHVGLFQENLPGFINDNKNIFADRLIVNIDADLYSSTLYVLIMLTDYLKSGDILFFDEFFSIVNSASEFRAYLDYRSISTLDFKFIAKTTTHCALQVV